MSGETKTPVLRFRTSSAASAEGGRPSPAAAPWVEKRLGSVADVTMGQSPDGSTYSDTASTYILVQGNADLKDGWVCPRIWTTQITKLAKAGSLLMSVRAPAGAMGKTSFDVVLGRGVAAIDGDDFLYQRLVKMYDDGYWKELSCGSTFESLNSDAINNATLLFPFDIAEQQSIGGFFRELDALIAEREKALGKLESLKKAMLEKMFPQGDAKVPEVRFKGFEGEWESKILAEVADVIGGGTPSTSNPEFWDGGINWFSPTEIGDSPFVGNSKRTITKAGLNNSSAVVLPPDKTILFTSRATIGEMAVLTKPAATNQGFQSFVVHDGTDVYFLFSCKPLIVPWAIQHAHGSTFLEISKTALEKTPLLIPSLLEQQQIGSFFRSLDALLAARREEAEKLKQLKKAFLERMFA